MFGVSGARKQTASSPAIAPTSEGWARFVRTINVNGGHTPERPLCVTGLECVYGEQMANVFLVTFLIEMREFRVGKC